MNKNTGLVIFLLISIIYILFGYGVTISNDSVENVYQITNLDLLSRSSHFSFHLFGIIFYLLFSELIGFSAVTSVEIMLAFFSAAAAFSLYEITIKKYNNVQQAVITVLIYSFASGVFRFSAQAEYLILVPSFGLISLYLYSAGKNLFAGIMFGFGLLTSPFIVLFAPMYLLFSSFKNVFQRKNIIFAAGTIAVYFAVNLFTYKETISGEWSYGGVFSFYKDAISDLNFLRIAAIYIYGYLRSFNIMLLFLPFTLYYLYKYNKELLLVFILTILIHLPVAIPEARYGGYQMTAYPIIAISIGYFLSALFTSRKVIVLTTIVVYLVLNISLVITERSFFRDLKDTYVKLNDDLVKNSVLFVYQASKPLKDIYAPDLEVFDILSDYQFKMAKDLPGYIPTDLEDIFNKNHTAYLLESGVSMPDDNIKLLFSQFTKDQGAKVKGFALAKVLETEPSLHYKKLDGYKLDVYKITKNKNE